MVQDEQEGNFMIMQLDSFCEKRRQSGHCRDVGTNPPPYKPSFDQDCTDCLLVVEEILNLRQATAIFYHFNKTAAAFVDLALSERRRSALYNCGLR
jgi:hypothetical protein